MPRLKGCTLDRTTNLRNCAVASCSFRVVFGYGCARAICFFQSIAYRMLLRPNTDSTFLKIYIPGHMRAASYFVGVAAGYLKYQMNVKNQKIPQTLVRIGWVACVPFMFFSLHISYIFYNMDTPAWISALYACLHHICWSLGVAWMVVAISSGYGGKYQYQSCSNGQVS